MRPTSTEEPLTVAEKMAIVDDLLDAALELKRVQLARLHPDADAEAVEAMLDAWLLERPGAEHGDGEGRPVKHPGNA